MKRSYVPMFSEIVDSSLWDEPLHVRVVFMTMWALKDFDHIVRLPIHKICNKANVGDDLFLDAMKVLSEPDRRTTITQPHEGRRIKQVEAGYFILNGEYYQKLMQEVNQQARWAKQKREQRLREPKKKKSKGGLAYLPGEHSSVRASEETGVVAMPHELETGRNGAAFDPASERGTEPVGDDGTSPIDQ